VPNTKTPQTQILLKIWAILKSRHLSFVDDNYGAAFKLTLFITIAANIWMSTGQRHLKAMVRGQCPKGWGTPRLRPRAMRQGINAHSRHAPCSWAQQMSDAIIGNAVRMHLDLVLA
jgi:hypothetical protein